MNEDWELSPKTLEWIDPPGEEHQREMNMNSEFANRNVGRYAQDIGERQTGYSIPTGLYPPAQGCEERATLGSCPGSSQPQRGCVKCRRRATTPLGLMPSRTAFPR